MIRIIFLLTTLAMTTFSYAEGLNKGSAQLHALGSAWKSSANVLPKSPARDLTIVYGGADVDHALTLLPHSTIG